MRATGIVRRIDDLGRVVIPKEIRKTLRIREGDPLEIFTAKDGEVILKKYSPIGELNEFSQEYAETLGETLGCGVIVTDLDSIIAVSKLPKKEYKEKSISNDLEQLIENRESKPFKDSKLVPLHNGRCYGVYTSNNYAYSKFIRGLYRIYSFNFKRIRDAI